MSRYIDADALRKSEIERCHCVPLVGSNENNCKDLDDVLNDAPTADVVEVRHGEWEHAGMFDDFAKCSVCGLIEHSLNEVYSRGTYNYCPNCGAKMDGGAK